MNDRLTGILLFLPVPLVLLLFTQAPLGVGPSLGLGVVLMLSHRLYARPFSLRRADRRCLWCGGMAADESQRFELGEPFGTTSWRACRGAHLDALRRVFAWAQAHAAFLRLGILGTLVAFLALASSGLLPFADAVALFRLGIAVTVLPFALLSARSPPGDGAPRVPFPAHIQALIGTSAVLWLFRLISLVWLVLVLRHLVGRLGGWGL